MTGTILEIVVLVIGVVFFGIPLHWLFSKAPVRYCFICRLTNSWKPRP